MFEFFPNVLNLYSSELLILKKTYLGEMTSVEACFRVLQSHAEQGRD